MPILSALTPELIDDFTSAISGADAVTLRGMLPAVYDDLRRVAAGFLREERPGHTLQPTALVHEAYLRMADQRQSRWQNRAHLLGVFARMMRRILIDHAGARQAAKRGGKDAVRITLDDGLDRILSQPHDAFAPTQISAARINASDIGLVKSVAGSAVP